MTLQQADVLWQAEQYTECAALLEAALPALADPYQPHQRTWGLYRLQECQLKLKQADKAADTRRQLEAVKRSPTPPAVNPDPVVYYVDVKSGDDAHTGLAPELAFRTLQQAADRVNPGDTVLVAPGLYYEHVKLVRFGTAAQPITFRSIEGQAKTIITGADRDIREKRSTWRLEDETLQLYSVPFGWTNAAPPTRLLYDGIDLFCYPDLDRLNAFALGADTNDPGPRHGFCLAPEGKRLYVRLYPGGRYGSPNPNEHTMAVVSSMDYALFDIPLERDMMPWPAYVVVDGFCFETPWRSGVQTYASQVTVSNCRFVGCRGGVAGLYLNNVPANITIHNCEYSQDAVYADGLDTLQLSRNFWHRKGKMYETGIALDIGTNWDIHHNYIHDAFEGLAAAGARLSIDLKLHDNRFERLLDNVVETEDHSRGMRIYRNVMIDAFSPVSWQPLRGNPWPGPVYCYQNVITSTPRHRKLFAFRVPSVFKIGATEARRQFGQHYVPEVPPPGLLFFNNTIYWPEGSLFWAALWGNNPDKVKLFSNIIVTGLNLPDNWRQDAPYLIFSNNLCVNMPREDLAGDCAVAIHALQLRDVAAGNFEPLQGSPARGRGIPIPETSFSFTNIGALQDDDWRPDQRVGCLR